MPANPQRPFRILALPLARIPRSKPHHLPINQSSNPSVSSTPDSSAGASSPNHDGESPEKPQTPLLLFHVCQPESSPGNGAAPSYTQKALDKASGTWLKLGERKKDSWMYWFYKKGESLMDRIEYEEWALKGVVDGRGVGIAKEGEKQEMIEIPLLKPHLPNQPLPTLLPKLHRMLIHRIPFHRKMMTRSLLAAPLTAPFALIPVVPNFPFFYVLWRAWSHYKAYRGATYLERLLKLGMIKEQTSKELDGVYAAKGNTAGEDGSVNRASNGTSTGGPSSDSPMAKQSSVPRSSPLRATGDSAALPAQAKGEEGAVDGTATPSSMIYEKSPTNGTGSTAATPNSAKAVRPLQTENENSKPVRHPNLLLGLDQVTLLAKAFDLKGNEVVDVNRAVEQAEMRARKAEEASVEKGEQGKEGEKAEKAGKEGKKAGTEWRGNLHR